MPKLFGASAMYPPGLSEGLYVMQLYLSPSSVLWFNTYEVTVRTLVTLGDADRLNFFPCEGIILFGVDNKVLETWVLAEESRGGRELRAAGELVLDFIGT